MHPRPIWDLGRCNDIEAQPLIEPNIAFFRRLQTDRPAVFIDPFEPCRDHRGTESISLARWIHTGSFESPVVRWSLGEREVTQRVQTRTMQFGNPALKSVRGSRRIRGKKCGDRAQPIIDDHQPVLEGMTQVQALEFLETL